MRKLIGFIFFVISLVIIIVTVTGSIELVNSFFDDITLEGLGILIGALWSVLYQPMVILLLSVIAMGDYQR